MATRDEVLAELNFPEKSSYRELITTGTENYVSEQIKYSVLSLFMQKNINRTTAVRNLILTKQEDAVVSDNYAVFRDLTKRIFGKNEELDRWNGILGQTVYGDVRKQRERKRVMAELTKRSTNIISEINVRYSEFKEEMDDIYAKLT